MTLPPQSIGDKGQQYVLQIKGWPEDGWNNAAFGNEEASLNEMGATFMKAPSASDCRVIDRSTLPGGFPLSHLTLRISLSNIADWIPMEPCRALEEVHRLKRILDSETT